MKRRGLLTILALVAVFLSVFVTSSSAQDSSPADGKHADVILSKLSPPIYPPISRVARISGDVTVVLGIRKDGTIESAAATSGPPLLHHASLQSAQKSQLECQNCSEAVTSYSLVYTFQLIPDPCSVKPEDRANQPSVGVTQSENHVTVVDIGGFCESIVATRVRAAKCLYLWKCGWR